MRKDELKSGDCCPDCVEAEEANAEPHANNTDECCCCCCSCSDCASESEGNDVSTVTPQNRVSSALKKQKKDLLSSLSILRTNREQTSIEQILQFVEALTHSADFLRRYNLLEDFCLECLLSEPTCSCCTNGISQLSVNDQSCDSCDECCNDGDSHHQAHPSQECGDCASSSKAPNPGRHRNRTRRERRQRRRQRNIRHNLPRVSTAPTNNASSPRDFPQLNPADRNHGRERQEYRNNPQLTQRRSHVLQSVGDNCEECEKTSIRNDSRRERNQTERLHDSKNCEECAGADASRRGSRTELQGSIKSKCANTSDICESCEECEGQYLPSTSRTFLCCEDCESTNGPFGNSSRNSSMVCPCARCNNSANGHEANRRPKDKSKRQRVSNRPECDQSETCQECSDSRRDLSGECSCEDCKDDSECSDESCNECRKDHSEKYKKK